MAEKRAAPGQGAAGTTVTDLDKPIDAGSVADVRPPVKSQSEPRRAR
jgi:hypothetical protein